MHAEIHKILQKQGSERQVLINVMDKIGFLMFLFRTWIITIIRKKSNIFNIPSLKSNKPYGHMFSFRSA